MNTEIKSPTKLQFVTATRINTLMVHNNTVFVGIDTDSDSDITIEFTPEQVRRIYNYMNEKRENPANNIY